MNKVSGWLTVIFLLSSGMLFAQAPSVTPYSIFGVGAIQKSDGGRLAGMAGAGYGVRGSRFFNTTNPASLTAIDSTTFLFDFAASGNLSRFVSGGNVQKAFNSNFSKVSLGTHITNRWSFGLYIMPFSTMSYKVEEETYIAGSDYKSIVEYTGNGGLTRFAISNGFAITDNLSVGLNTVFLFGGIENTSTSDQIIIRETARSSKIMFDFGLQYSKTIGEYKLGLGLVGGYPDVLTFENRRVVENGVSNIETEYKQSDTQFTIPEFYGGGISLSKGYGLIIAADYRFEKWSRSKDMNTGRQFKDTHKVNVGMAFIPNEQYASSYFEIIQYQMGATVSNSYLNLKGYNPIEYEFSAGVGLPFKGGSLMNVAFAYGKKGTTKNNLIREDYVRIILSFSISEKWFEKRLYN